MRLLVVEDEPNVATALQRGLQAEGYDVDVAHDGDSGYWMASEHRYDLLVLDIMLPGRNGYVLCSDLRADGSDVPILMLTAKDGDYDQAEGLDTGADDYLTKPFSFVVLNARVRALLRRGHLQSSPTLSVGDLEIDPRTRRCARNGASSELTPREFTLLETLARAPGAVFTKSELLDRVWGPDFDGGPNVVEVYIGYLRRKVDDGHDVKRIETVHGHGYRMVP